MLREWLIYEPVVIQEMYEWNKPEIRDAPAEAECSRQRHTGSSVVINFIPAGNFSRAFNTSAVSKAGTSLLRLSLVQVLLDVFFYAIVPGNDTTLKQLAFNR